MTSDEYRKRVKQAYPGQKWSDRVDKMSDAQLFATFQRLVNQGRIKN